MENSKACKLPFKIIHIEFVRLLSFQANFCRLSSNSPVPSPWDTSQQCPNSWWDSIKGGLTNKLYRSVDLESASSCLEKGTSQC